MKKSSGPYLQEPGRGNMEKTGRGIPMEFKGPHQDHDGPDPNLTKEESNLLDTQALSDSRREQLRGKKGFEFTQTLNDLQKAQRFQDSSFIVNNRTIKDLKPVKNTSGESSSLLSPQGASRPSRFRRGSDGNIEAY